MDPATILLLGLLVLVYLNFMGRRRAQRERNSLLQRLVPGAEVVTTSGLHGTVTEVAEDGTLLLRTAPGHESRWEKLAVGKVVSSPADAATAVDDEPAQDEEPAEPGVPADRAVQPAVDRLPDTAPPDRA